MEISSRQIVALGAPLIVTYLTWSAVSGEVAPAPAPKAATISTASVSKRPQIGPLARNPFAPASQAADGDALEGLEGDPNDPEQASAPLKLDGTVVTGRWRMAIINGERVFEGQTYRGRLRLEKVTTDSVTLVDATGGLVHLQLDIARPPAAPPNEKKTGTNVSGLETLMRNFAQAVKEGAERDGDKAPAAKKPGDGD